jgi:hypothetical protein
VSEDQETQFDSIHAAIGWAYAEGADSVGDEASEELKEIESRLAKVPALVETLTEVRDLDPNVIAVVNGGLHKRIREALAEWERE